MNMFSIRLSKFLSYILRHNPKEYNLTLDKNGYADLKNVINVLKERFRFFKEDDLYDLLKEDKKGRFEIKDNKIRATYGHSVEVVPVAENVSPPDELYHGSSREGAEKILKEGLHPMGRQFVHLSVNEDDAYSVGLRHDKDPLILTIEAAKAYENGVKFYKEKNIYLSEYIPKEYIKPI